MMFPHYKNLNRGTEKTAEHVNKNILPKLTNIKKYDARLMPGDLLESNNPVIFWIHNMPYQFTDGKNPNLREILDFCKYDIKHIIAVSNFHKQKCEEFFGEIPIHVCNNGIYPLNPDVRKFEDFKKPKLIYSSIPQRGLDMLLSATELIDLDFELYIFSEYQPDWRSNDYFDKYENDSRIFFFGQTPNKSVKKICEDAHIHSYPCTYEESFCVSLVECLSSGCLPVIPTIGALPEISNNIGIQFNWTNEFLEPLQKKCGTIHSMYYYFEQPEIYKKNVEIFAEKLHLAIECINKKEWNPEASISRGNNFNWKNIEKQWQNLDAII